MKIVTHKLSVLFTILLSLFLIESCRGSSFSGAANDTGENEEEKTEEEEENAEMGGGGYDQNGDGEISEEEFEKIKDQLGPIEFVVQRIEDDCLGGCNATATFSLYKVDGSKVSSAVKELSKTIVSIDKRQKGAVYTSGDGSHLCSLANKNVVLEMSVTYNGQPLELSDTSRVLGGREDNKTIWWGVSDTNCGAYFHNVDTIITSMKCPKSKKIKIQYICEDTTLDDSKLRKCWATKGTTSTDECPNGNSYGTCNSSSQLYPVQCR